MDSSSARVKLLCMLSSFLSGADSGSIDEDGSAESWVYRADVEGCDWDCVCHCGGGSSEEAEAEGNEASNSSSAAEDAAAEEGCKDLR
nr:hypothetical protein [Thecaphora frezii]